MPDGTQSEVERIAQASDGDVVREAIALTKRIKEISGQLTPLQDKLKALQPKLLEEFEKTGDQRRTVDGMTAYMRRDLWVYLEEGIDKEAAIEALEKAGLGDFVKEEFNISSVSAFARELEKEADWQETGALLEDAVHPFLVNHPELEGLFKPTEKFSVRIVAA